MTCLKLIKLYPNSGKFMVRVPPEIHRNLVILAAESGISLNLAVSSKLSQELYNKLTAFRQNIHYQSKC